MMNELGRFNRKNNKKKRIVIAMLFALTIVALIGTSFALWQLTLVQTNPNTLTTDCFKISFNDESPISIENAYPITDEEGISLTPYNFTLTNMCDSFAIYDINIETLNTSTLVDLDYIKVLLNEENYDDEPNLLTSNTKIEPLLENASSGYKIKTGYLDYKESKTFNLRLWMDLDTPLDEKYMSKTLENRVTITTSFTKDMPLDTRNMMIERYDQNNNDNYDFINDTTKIVFRNKKTNPTDLEVIDISQNKDNSVVAYNDTSSGSKITYIEANGKIKFPVNSKYLLRSNKRTLSSIDGLELVDTRQVTNMDSMFIYYSGTTLNLSGFDTQNVTSMHSMFNYCNNLIELDVNSLNTRKVTDIAGMFANCSSLTSLNLSNFDTSNVTYLLGMFQGCSSLTTLDLSNFNLGKATSTSTMFYGCRNLTSLDLSSFNTTNITDMSSMFYSCRSLTNLDLSNFDTSKVAKMDRMFEGCASLKTTLNITNSSLTDIILFNGAATNEGAQITINYTTETSDLVDRMIAIKTPASTNIVKGVKLD